MCAACVSRVDVGYIEPVVVLFCKWVFAHGIRAAHRAVHGLGRNVKCQFRLSFRMNGKNQWRGAQQ